jgi:hypothetical protein
MHALIDLAWSAEFRKALSANSHGRLIPGDRWIGLNLVVCFHVFLPFGFRGSVAKLCYLFPSWDTSLTFHGEVRSGECEDNPDMRTNNGDFYHCGVFELAW